MSVRDPFGDYPTPAVLAAAVVEVAARWVAPATVVEPTCGDGALLRAAAGRFGTGPAYLGFEVDSSRAAAARQVVPEATVRQADFYTHPWERTFRQAVGPLLVVANPPWVTARKRGQNLPPAPPAGRSGGPWAGTGGYDISEPMIVRLVEALAADGSVVAVLAKTGTVRRVLAHMWEQQMPVARAGMWPVDTEKHFGVSTHACLFVCQMERTAADGFVCDLWPPLGDDGGPVGQVGWDRGRLIADPATYQPLRNLSGRSPRRWRSGIKHDCADVCVLAPSGTGQWRNGAGVTVRLEDSCLFPLLRSSDLIHHRASTRMMLVTQRTVSDDPARLADGAPHTWAYLNDWAARFDRRRSTVWRNRPRFAMYGVGEYTFGEWKVATSGFVTPPRFRAVGPVGGKPVVFDDTCYFVGCDSQADAEHVAAALNSRPARRWFSARAFSDMKRPVTARLLNDLNLDALVGR